MTCYWLCLWLGRCDLLLLCRGLGSNFRLISLNLHACEIWFCHEWEQLQQQLLLLILGKLHATCLRKFRIWLVLILRNIVVTLLANTANLQAELRVNLHRGSTILALHKVYELIVLGGIHWATRLQVEGAVHCLCSDNLRCRGYEWRKTCRKAHLRNQLHSLWQDILGLQSLQLSHHIRVHTARYLCLLNEFVRCWEAEVCLNLLCCIEQCCEVLLLGSSNCTIELLINLGRSCIYEWVE